MSLLERWLLLHTLAGAVPAGRQFEITEAESAFSVPMDAEDPLVGFCRPASATPEEGGGEEGEEGDETGERSHPLIALYVPVMLFALQCRTEARMAELTGAEAKAFSDDVREDLDTVLYKDRATFTAALGAVSPHALAKRNHSARPAVTPSGRTAAPGGPSAGSPSKARGKRSRGAPKGAAKARDASDGAKPNAGKGLCFKWTRGECTEADCGFRHWLTAAEVKGAGAKKAKGA